MSLRKSWSVSVEISPAFACSVAATSGSTSSTPVDHLDLELLERCVELVELAGVGIELVERGADVVGAQLSRRASALQELPAFVRLQQIGDLWSGIPW